MAVATAAPAFAASCTPIISFKNGVSCKCPGQSANGEEFAYYLGFCVTNDCTTGNNSGGTFKVISVEKDNNSPYVNTPNNCFPATISTTSTDVNSCTTDIFRFISTNSGNFVDVSFTVTVNGVTTPYTQTLPSPPKCDDASVTPVVGRCELCTK